MTDATLRAQGRALTDEQKREVVDRIYLAWTQAPDLRLGQLIANATGLTDPFWVEDHELARAVETSVSWTEGVR